MNRFFLTPTSRGWKNHGDWFAPEVDVTEEEKQYLVKADLPGMRKEDIEVSVTNNILTIKGEKKEETEKKEKNFYSRERRFGGFQRSIQLPLEVDRDQVKASYKDGVLELVIPKAESAKPKQIKVDIKKVKTRANMKWVS